MTRIQRFAAELTREMLEAFFDGYPVRPRAARAVAEARIREFVGYFSVWYDGVNSSHDYLNETDDVT